MPEEPSLNATAIVSALNKHGVTYVVIGAFAAIAQRAPIAPTRDIDITPDRSRSNCERLSAALSELQARVRTQSVPDGLAFNHDGASIQSVDVWNLTCPDGEFDISFGPAAFPEGFASLLSHAHRVRVGEVEILVADLDDVIRSKEAAGRPKDIQALPALYRHRDRRRRTR
ncbi:MAG: hypothetical protein JOZ46_06180 [Candidatus Dormibacteraeota bacterium]|nr:hypothetical protein [Candidatus Dormibacteraeota bacterium]MBV9525386.1 hypothetical protein [Candidatus Dormibacteraeota bacterium]